MICIHTSMNILPSQNVQLWWLLISKWFYVCRYKEGRYPENLESLTISNTSFMNVEVSFFFHKDCNGSTYLLNPRSMRLEPGQSRVS